LTKKFSWFIRLKQQFQKQILALFLSPAIIKLKFVIQ